MSEAELHVMQARMRGHLLRRGECLDSPQRVVLDTSGLLDFIGGQLVRAESGRYLASRLQADHRSARDAQGPDETPQGQQSLEPCSKS
jgi:hypothetical protein